MSPTVSAIVVNYNAGELLHHCISSLLNCRIVDLVVVVDNASSDNSIDTVSNLKRVQVIRNEKNLGFATACNIGLSKISSDFVLFLNPDCAFEPGELTKILDCMQKDRAIGMAGGVLINPDGSEQAGGRRAIPTPWRSFVRAFGLYRFADRWPRLFYDFYLHQQPLPAKPIAVEALSGACMLVRQSAIADVGPWDENYFLHCEDLDWCMRFRQKGWKIMFVPTAKVTHVAGTCSRSRPIFVEWHKHKGMLRFYRKFFRHQYPGIMMGLVTVGVWLRFVSLVVYYAVSNFLRRAGANQ